MEEKQLEYLIDSLRGNEEKTCEIAKVLNDFNGALGSLVESVGTLVQVDTLKEGTKSLKGLEERLGHIDEQLKQLESSKVYLSDSAIMYKDKILVVGADRKSLYEYSPDDEILTLKITLGYSIKFIWSIRHKLYALSTEGEVYSVGLQNCLAEQIEDIKICTYGMILKNKMQRLIFYPLLGEPVELSKDIVHFEVLMDKYLLYTTCDQVKQVDLQCIDNNFSL